MRPCLGAPSVGEVVMGNRWAAVCGVKQGPRAQAKCLRASLQGSSGLWGRGWPERLHLSLGVT